MLNNAIREKKWRKNLELIHKYPTFAVYYFGGTLIQTN